MKKFDLVVIGGGSAGMNVVHRAANEGWQVAIIEESHLGGTCINVGCIPSKALIRSAEVMHTVREAVRFGVIADPPRADWPAMLKRKDDLVGRIRSRGYKNVENNPNITLFEGQAVFTGPRELSVNGETLTAAKVVIACGARSALPPISGLEDIDYLTSTTVMEMGQLPKSMLIIGGGVIALEFSQLFRRLGLEVTVLQRNKRLGPALEEEISAEIETLLKKEGVKVKTGADISTVGRDGDLCYALDESEGQPVRYSAEKILLATGRTPNSDRLKVVETGVKTDSRGFIKIDSSYKTSARGVWAIGDITGGMMFTHRAWHDGLLLSRHLINGQDISNEGRLIPFAIFTDPEIASVGMGEKRALAAGYKVRIQRFPFAFQGRALAAGKTDGFIKLVVNKSNGKILGAHIIGPEGGELVHELIASIRFGATVSDLQDMMHIHPTLSEAINNAAWAD